jgi:type IV secretion system protein VirB11
MDNASAAEANLRWRCFVDRGHGMERITLPYTFDDLEDIAINAAALTRQDIAEDVPLVSTRFPDGQRVQIVRPPAVADGQLAFSIRQPRRESWTPADLERGGVFADAAGRHARPPRPRERLLSLYQAGEWRAFLELAVTQRLNIVFSGTVGSGKTHNLKAFTHAVPRSWRLVTIEDMPELVGLPHANVVNLFYSKGGQSIASTRAEDLVEAALRMGMDGLLNQELRDEAAYAYLQVLASGHWGMTTTHADSAGQARDRIRGLIKQHPAGRHLADADVMTALERAIDVVVHCVRDGAHRHIEQILYDPERKDHAPRSGIFVPLAAE